jgi:hypothetical protein
MGDRERKERNSFAGLGIPVGTTLFFKKKQDVAVVTVDGLNRVKYEGGEVAISTLATKLNGYPSNGFDFFYLDGTKLSKLREKVSGGGNAGGDAVSEGSREPVQAETSLPESVPNQPEFVPDQGDEAVSSRDLDPLAGSKPDEFDI